MEPQVHMDTALSLGLAPPVGHLHEAHAVGVLQSDVNSQLPALGPSPLQTRGHRGLRLPPASIKSSTWARPACVSDRGKAALLMSRERKTVWAPSPPQKHQGAFANRVVLKLSD